MEKLLPSLSRKVAPNTFSFDSSDHFLAAVLKDHGWIEVPKTNISWHLKWTWKADDKQIQGLMPQQMINHFPSSDEIATKLGLALLLKRNNMINDEGKSYSWFFPRSYNLSSQYQQFVQDFIRTGVLNLLKKMVACVQLFHPEQYGQALKMNRNKSNHDTHHCIRQLLEDQKVFTRRASSLFQVNSSMFLRLLFYLEHLFSLDSFYSFKNDELIQLLEYSKEQIPFTGVGVQCPSDQSIALLLSFHQRCLKSYPSYFQDGFGNVWVMKGNYSSRGRSIQLVDSLAQIRNLSNGMKLIQKYIQNVWILQSLSFQQLNAYPYLECALGRKFDIRFWVLVKSYSPLEIYIYEQGYLRLSSQDYKLHTIDDNRCHLTNYSTNWKNTKLKQIFSDESIVLYSDFTKFLYQERGVNTHLLWEKICKICVETLRSAEIKQVANSFELLGFDILLDAECNPWLLECNMSPSCAPRGKLKTVAKDMAAGMLGILGLIKSPPHAWRQLIKQIAPPKKTMRMNDTSSTWQLSMMSQTGFYGQALVIRPLKWSKYKSVERAHYVLEKIKIIQIFYKNRVSGYRLPKWNSSRCVKVIEALAKLAKRVKSKHWKHMSRRSKKIPPINKK